MDIGMKTEDQYKSLNAAIGREADTSLCVSPHKPSCYKLVQSKEKKHV